MGLRASLMCNMFHIDKILISKKSRNNLFTFLKTYSNDRHKIWIAKKYL